MMYFLFIAARPFMLFHVEHIRPDVPCRAAAFHKKFEEKGSLGVRHFYFAVML